MARQTITFDSDTVKIVALNPKVSDYKATIQNNTTQTITVTVTNHEMKDSPVFGVPAQGAFTIAAATIGLLEDPYQGMTLTATSTSGTVNITESER